MLVKYKCSTEAINKLVDYTLKTMLVKYKSFDGNVMIFPIRPLKTMLVKYKLRFLNH